MGATGELSCCLPEVLRASFAVLVDSFAARPPEVSCEDELDMAGLANCWVCDENLFEREAVLLEDVKDEVSITDCFGLFDPTRLLLVSSEERVEAKREDLVAVLAVEAPFWDDVCAVEAEAGVFLEKLRRLCEARSLLVPPEVRRLAERRVERPVLPERSALCLGADGSRRDDPVRLEREGRCAVAVLLFLSSSFVRCREERRARLEDSRELV